MPTSRIYLCGEPLGQGVLIILSASLSLASLVPSVPKAGSGNPCEYGCWVDLVCSHGQEDMSGISVSCGHNTLLCVSTDGSVCMYVCVNLRVLRVALLGQPWAGRRGIDACGLGSVFSYTGVSIC